MMRIGLLGYVCACPTVAAATSTAEQSSPRAASAKPIMFDPPFAGFMSAAVCGTRLPFVRQVCPDPGSLRLDTDPRDQFLHGGNLGSNPGGKLIRRAGNHFEAGLARLLLRLRAFHRRLTFPREPRHDLR